MRRTTRKAVLNFSIFGTALLLILFFNRESSSSRAFAWSTVQYRSSTRSLPPAHGVCPGLLDTQKPALVVSRVEADGDAKWLDTLADKYHICVYNVDGSASADGLQELRAPSNRGHEAMAYLTFIIDNYEAIPEAGIVFVHGSRWSWHNDAPDYDNKALLLDLNVPSALEQNGYHNLRCDWSAGTCGESAIPGQQPKTLPQGSLELKMTARLEPWNKRAVSDAALPAVFARFFGGEDPSAEVLLGRSDILRAQCCAQFVVARERVHQHSRDEYMAIRQWLLSEESIQFDDRIAGRILSYLWHVLFLPDWSQTDASDSATKTVDLGLLNSLACPNAEACYCRLYGRCKLQCKHPGHCLGQYSVPKDYKLPDDWIYKHSDYP